MKNILYIIVTTLLLISCSSETSESDLNEGNRNGVYKAVFQVHTVDAEQPLLKSASLKEMNIKQLEYWLYKSSDIDNMDAPYGAESLKHEVIKEDDFNKNITFDLPEGDYTLVFYAATFETEGHEFAVVGTKGFNEQMFSAKITFVLNEQNFRVSEQVILDRIIGRVELIIEDLSNLPEEVQSITPYVDGYIGLTPRHLHSVRIYSQNLILNHTYAGEGNAFPTIPRSEFSKINKDNPIVIYSLGTNTRWTHSQPGPWVEDFYIQGTTDNSFYTPDYNGKMSENVIFTRKVGAFEVKANQTIRYIGKIGNLSETGMGLDFVQEWDETSTGIDK